MCHPHSAFNFHINLLPVLPPPIVIVHNTRSPAAPSRGLIANKFAIVVHEDVDQDELQVQGSIEASWTARHRQRHLFKRINPVYSIAYQAAAPRTQTGHLLLILVKRGRAAFVSGMASPVAF